MAGPIWQAQLGDSLVMLIGPSWEPNLLPHWAPNFGAIRAAASLCFEIWGVVDPGKKCLFFSGNFTKNRFFRTNFLKISIFTGNFTEISILQGKFPKNFHF